MNFYDCNLPNWQFSEKHNFILFFYHHSARKTADKTEWTLMIWCAKQKAAKVNRYSLPYKGRTQTQQKLPSAYGWLNQEHQSGKSLLKTHAILGCGNYIALAHLLCVLFYSVVECAIIYGWISVLPAGFCFANAAPVG